MCSLWPFSLDAKQEDEDLHVVVEKSGVTVTINKEIEEISREEIVDETDSYQSNQSKLNERMHSHTIIDSIEPMDSSCLQTTAFLPQSNVFDSIDLIHEFFFNLIPHWHSISHPMPIWRQFTLQNSSLHWCFPVAMPSDALNEAQNKTPRTFNAMDTIHPLTLHTNRGSSRMLVECSY